MNVKLESFPTYRIAYMRQVGPYGQLNRQVMEKLKNWVKEKRLDQSTSGMIFGIAQDNPNNTAPENCRYDACVVIPKEFQLDHSVCEAELPAGQYAVYTVKHTEEDIKKAWDEIIPDLTKRNFRIDKKPIIERYTSEMIDNNYCELCVPIITI